MGLVRGFLLLLEANESQRLSTESGLIAASNSAPDPTQQPAFDPTRKKKSPNPPLKFNNNIAFLDPYQKYFYSLSSNNKS